MQCVDYIWGLAAQHDPRMVLRVSRVPKNLLPPAAVRVRLDGAQGGSAVSRAAMMTGRGAACVRRLPVWMTGLVARRASDGRTELASLTKISG